MDNRNDFEKLAIIEGLDLSHDVTLSKPAKFLRYTFKETQDKWEKFKSGGSK